MVLLDDDDDPEVVDESWLRSYVNLSGEAMRALDLRYPVQLLTAITALAEELSIDVGAKTSVHTWRMLDRLLAAVSCALEEGWRVLETRQPEIAAASVEGLTLEEARQVMIDLGWANSYVDKSVTWKSAPEAARRHVAARLTKKLQRPMMRWGRPRRRAG